MNLLGLNQGNQNVITGLVLLGAVLIDSLSKRGRAARGSPAMRHLRLFAREELALALRSRWTAYLLSRRRAGS